MSSASAIVPREPRVSAPPRRSFVVRVMEGRDRGKSFVLDESGSSCALVGQGAASFVQLTDPDVSRRHAALERAGDRLRLVDLGSLNGTQVGGLTVIEALLEGGETIRMGQTLLLVEAPAAEASPAVAAPNRFGRFVGGSEAIRAIYPLCAKLAASTIPVAIGGETGTGKEVLAEALHAASPRAAMPFVVFDCTAATPSLMESALFGHEKGAFTGAVATRRGVFEQADGGTLLIDEIGDLELALQPKLLRALQRGEIQRVGGEKWIKVDVRIIATTRRDLDREVQEGRFRDDLFYRLAVARIELPPLRRRQGDIALLTQHFRAQLGGAPDLAPDVVARFEAHDWPGNVRELFNAVSRRVALGELADAPLLSVSPSMASDDRDATARVIAMELPFARARDTVVEDFERRYVSHLLEKYDGDSARAAVASGIARRYFQMIRARSSAAT